MKKLFFYFFTILSILFISCSTGDDDNTITEVDFKSQNFLVGKWMQVGSYGSVGSGQFYVDVSDGEVLEFSIDGKFTSSRYPESTGNYTVDDMELTLEYNSEIFNAEFPDLDGTFTYSIDNESHYLLLSPLTRICIEGCSDKFKKVTN